LLGSLPAQPKNVLAVCLRIRVGAMWNRLVLLRLSRWFLIGAMVFAPSSAAACVGDCDAKEGVTVDELVRGVDIALGGQLLAVCPAFDSNDDKKVTVDELVQGVNNALNGCPPAPLTPEGQLWAQRIIEHAQDMVAGRPVNEPPFVDPDIAESIALVASVIEKIAQNPEDFSAVTRDPDYVAVLDLIRQRVAAGETVTGSSLGSLYAALNARVTTYPSPSSSSPGASAVVITPESILTFVIHLADSLNPLTALKEAATDGQRVIFEATHPAQLVDIDLVNGIQTSFMNGLYATVYVGAQLGADINHIHNAALLVPGVGLLVQSAATALQKLGLLNGPVAQQVATQILDHARSGQPYIVLCHSQGAAICARGAQRALAAAARDPVLQNRIRKLTGIITLGGFTTGSEFPPDMLVRPIVRAGDPVPDAANILDWSNPNEAVLEFLRALPELALTEGNHDLTGSYANPAGTLREFKEELTLMRLQLLQNWLALPKTCGNGAVDYGEVCDGAADDACPGRCIPKGEFGECRCRPDPPSVMNFTCNGASLCSVDSGEEFTLAFIFKDSDGDANRWRIIALAPDGVVPAADALEGEISPPAGNGAVSRRTSVANVCPDGQRCRRIRTGYAAQVFDVTGLSSIPAVVFVDVAPPFGSGGAANDPAARTAVAGAAGTFLASASAPACIGERDAGVWPGLSAQMRLMDAPRLASTEARRK
jgi:hypothetical protein